MSINSILKREGIEIKSALNQSQMNKIVDVISNKICLAFPEHNLNYNDIFSTLSQINMYIAKMPPDSSIAKYFYKNNSIYFSDKIDLNNIDTLTIHECIHALQEIKNNKGKLLRLGLYDLSTNNGQGINEAAVQLMASIASKIPSETVKYYNMTFKTKSPLYYPIQTALINQITYFTGTYPLFHSTLFSNNIFKNTLIAKTSEKFYNTIEKNFDLIIHYEELLGIYSAQLNSLTETDNCLKAKKINVKINSVKSLITSTTIETQNLIIEHCFNSEFDLIKDAYSLGDFREKLYNFKDFIIDTDSYIFFNDFYCEMMNKLEEKNKLIQEHGVLTYLNDLQTDLLELEQAHFGIKFFNRLFKKLKLLFEEAIRDKSSEN